MPLRVRESPIYILMQDCRKTSVLGEVTHEPRTATFESKRERVQIGYIWGFPLPGGAYLLFTLRSSGPEDESWYRTASWKGLHKPYEDLRNAWILPREYPALLSSNHGFP